MKPTVRVSFDANPEPAPALAPQHLLWGWFHIPHPEPQVMEIHLMPASDTGTHAFDTGCLCGAHEDPHAPGFFIHFAFDGREAYDSGQRKRH